MTKYQAAKEKARQEAIDWQNDFKNHNYSWSELADWFCYFSKKAHRYGLTKEFKDNGIF